VKIMSTVDAGVVELMLCAVEMAASVVGRECVLDAAAVGAHPLALMSVEATEEGVPISGVSVKVCVN
jgi:hypothetical protein